MSGGKKPKVRARAPRKQYAALPWRTTEDGQVEILLITSRETGRWIIPKGWPIKGLSPEASAPREAFEEAGVTGTPIEAELGHYGYDKRLQDGRSQPVRVSVFELKVSGEAASWHRVKYSPGLSAPQSAAQARRIQCKIAGPPARGI